MKKTCITNRKTGNIIYEGNFKNRRQAVEQAILENISMTDANLRQTNLDNATLDGGDFRGADLSGASLIGANISEADFTNAIARNADFTQSCLCESRLINTDFTDANFGITLIAGATIDNCIFSGGSALSLAFNDTRLGTNTFIIEGRLTQFATCPIVITGMAKKIAIFDSAIAIGNRLYPRDNAAPFSILQNLEELCRQATG